LKKFVGAAVAASILLAGCATNPNQISASYVSSVPYQNYSCEQLATEAQRVSNAAGAATGAQSSQASKDAVMTTVGIVLFWPALFFIGGDKGNASEIARLKGEMNAIEQANITKNCGIQFQKPAAR
jgi:outer membrane murein-binding lipoprotein Lpp